MELCFSSNSQSLSLFYSSHFFSSSKAPSLRSHFLGSSHNLRSPRSLRGKRPKKLKTREKNLTQKLFINASLSLDSVFVVVGVSTFSAVSFAYFHHQFASHNSRKKENAPEQVLGYGLSQLGRKIVNNIIRRRVPEVTTTTLEVQSKDFVENARKNHSSYVTEIALANETSILVENASESDHTNAHFAVSSSVSTYVVPEENGACSDLSVPVPVIRGGESVLPLEFAKELSELSAEKSKNANDVECQSNQLSEEKSNTDFSTENYDLGEKVDDFSNYYDITKESTREDLYTFYEKCQTTGNASTKVNGLNMVSSHATPSISKKFSLLKVNAVAKEAELSEQQSPQAAESVESSGHYKRGSSRKTENIGGRKGFPREKEKGHSIQDKHTKLLEFPNPNGVHAANRDTIPEPLSAYNLLLRDGRLAECVDLLEDMESRGLLDMSKIYHAKFFKTCKTQKAVKEAFRFCKLVPNPTLSTYNMLMSVCANSQESDGAFAALQLAQGAGLKADCKLYTTLISTCAKSGKVDAMFEVFHEMVNAEVEPNVHTYGALIDGCARAGQMAKAFGAYGILRSKNVKPDRVVFNALITACGQSGAVDRAFDVLAEMVAETQPIDPDHITVGALMKACAKAGQVDRAKKVYKMMHKYRIKGTPEVYTIAVNCCSQNGDWDFARNVYDDMTKNGVAPDEVFLSALIDVAGHAGMVDVAFETLQEARIQGTQLGIVPYSSLMGACSNAKNWQKALELYEEIKAIRLKPTVSTMNALITSLCDGDQLAKAIEILSEMRSFGLCPNTVTYSILFTASERKDDLDVSLMLLSQAKDDNVSPTLFMYKSIIGMCLRRYEKACSLGERVLSFDSGQPQIKNDWTSLALRIYRETITASEKPTMEVVSQVLGCLQLPCDASLKKRLVEDLGVTADPSKLSNLCALVDGFGEYDPRAFSLLEEASSLGIVPCLSVKESPIVMDAKSLQSHIAEVYFLTILKGLKYRLAAGAKLPNLAILLPTETTQIKTPKGEKTINLAGRLSQDVASLLRRLGLAYQGNESYGKIRINGISLRRWLRPKLASPFGRKPEDDLSFSLSRVGKGIQHQQRNIRTGNLSLD